MVVYVPPVRVRADNVGVLALEETLGQLASNAVGLLGRNLSGLERLANVVCNYARSLATRPQRVLPFR